MNNIKRAVKVGGTALLLGFGLGACNDFLTVKNPNNILVSAIDPETDAPTLAASAQQDLAAAYGWLSMYQSWFTGEMRVAETFPTRHEFGRRDVTAANGSHNAEVWTPLSRALAAATIVSDLELPDTNVNRIRGLVVKGYSFVLMAESFCEGVLRGGPSLATNAMLDSAVVAFETAIAGGTANGTAAAVSLANAARVGAARAHLQAGRKPQAAALANAVPAGFVFNFTYLDDPAQRTRLGNRQWQFVFSRGSLQVAPAFRVNDPRVPFKLPSQHSLVPFDAGSGDFVIQDKYPAWQSPMRLASKMEADYIAAEAGSTAEQLALIAARRAANGQPAYAGATDANSVLTELMEQRGREFYLEVKRMGDLRRNPTNVLNAPQPGATYFREGFAPIGTQVCWPLPLAETDNNPNFGNP
jgi:hypothetical protein